MVSVGAIIPKTHTRLLTEGVLWHPVIQFAGFGKVTSQTNITPPLRDPEAGVQEVP